ncbi:MAG: SocA family protein [Loktanella sp.]|nr:SocA family protein [Loktanella sp.]
MGEAPYDPRIVANLILETRKFIGLSTTQIELQKLLYFCYEAFLIQRRQRLTLGYFEAWQYGPVHPDVYRAFKAFRGTPITEYAKSTDPFTRETKALPRLEDPDIRRHVVETVTKLSGLTSFELVNLSHAPDGPWHSVVKSAKESVALGLRITDDTILSNRPHGMLMREGHHTATRGVVPDDEEPLTRNGPL